MKKVAIYDLRGNDEWSSDWVLVARPFNKTLNFDSIDKIAYKDYWCDMLFYIGSDKEAYRYYTDYCKKNNLQLVGYDTLESLYDRKILLSDLDVEYAYRVYSKLNVVDNCTCMDEDLETMLSENDITITGIINRAKEFAYNENYEPTGCNYGDYLHTVLLKQEGDDNLYACQVFCVFNGSGADTGLLLENIYVIEQTDVIKLRPYANQIISLFENILDKYNIIVPDEDRDNEDKEQAAIYGMTYFNLEDDIVAMLSSLTEEVLASNKDTVINSSYYE